MIAMHRIGLASLAVLVASSLANAAPISWDGEAGSGNEQWSNFTNFNPDGDPAGDDLTFDATAAAVAAGTVKNIVDSSVSINALIYQANSGSGSFHTTQIDSGQANARRLIFRISRHALASGFRGIQNRTLTRAG